MAERVMEAEVVEERIVTCPQCRRSNRLYRRSVSGVYRCGACRAALSNPFGARRARFPWMLVIGVVAASFFGLLLIVVIVAVIAESPRSSTDQDAMRRAAERSDKLIDIGPSALPPIPAPNYTGSYQARVPPSAPQTEPSTTIPPELTPPASGSVFTYTSEEGLAPFKIKSSRGTNYLIKLVDASSNRPVLTTYIHGGDTVDIAVPLGTYVVKYAYGDKWYGYDYLFGSKTGYTKASELFTFDETDTKFRGHTMTLYTVPYGNLRTERIKSSEF